MCWSLGEAFTTYVINMEYTGEDRMKIRLNTIDINLLLPTAYVRSKKSAGFDGQFFLHEAKSATVTFYSLTKL